MLELREILAAVDEWYPPELAESWDAPGLTCGDRAEPVDAVLLAVDAVPATVAQAIDGGAQLLLTHHPLLLRGVHGVPAEHPKGALVHRMIRAGVAHYAAHTNADAARPGVADALADRLGLTGTRPLEPLPAEPLDKLVTFVPVADADRLLDALAAAGAGAIGDYDRCAWTTEGIGTFRPGTGAHPAIGRPGEIARVPETRLEIVLPRCRRDAVVAALRAAHPYEEVAFDVFEHAALPSERGAGRIGELGSALTLRQFTALAAAALPATSWGVRAAGDPDRPVRVVAVCGGAGGSLTDAARQAGADAYLTADLRHHPALEAVTERGPRAMALVDAAHWATEAPWLDVAARRLRDRFGAALRVEVSAHVTDPWSLHVPSTVPSAASPAVSAS
ncbi:MAG: Nif3-like dinuclear metal center hexameric protein [Actinomycetia bacterium]|nr:Nif3-like dinuclear metal center hexameric protein [Actinomycetes bacterium]